MQYAQLYVSSRSIPIFPWVPVSQGTLGVVSAGGLTYIYFRPDYSSARIDPRILLSVIASHTNGTEDIRGDVLYGVVPVP